MSLNTCIITQAIASLLVTAVSGQLWVQISGSGRPITIEYYNSNIYCECVLYNNKNGHLFKFMEH